MKKIVTAAESIKHSFSFNGLNQFKLINDVIEIFLVYGHD